MRARMGYKAVSIIMPSLQRTHLIAIDDSHHTASISSRAEPAPILGTLAPRTLLPVVAYLYSGSASRFAVVLFSSSCDTTSPAHLTHLPEDLLDNVHAGGVELLVLEAAQVLKV